MKHVRSMPLFKKLHSLQRGQLIVELLVAIGIAAIFLPALLTSLVASREGKAQQQQRLIAVNILKETQDAVRVVRENGWSTFAVNGTYHPLIDSGTWTLASGSATNDGFTTEVVLSDVFRDSDGAIVLSGGTLDPSTKRIDTTISWTLPYVSDVHATMYLTRFLDNASYTETTQTQFNAGTKTGVVVRATTSSVADDGEVILGAGGNSDWCSPELLATAGATLDLPGQGYPSTITAIEGKAFAGTGENASGMSFMGITIPTNTTPPTPQLGSTFDGHKTNNVFGESDYGYIATDTNGKEIVIIDIAGGTYSEEGYFNAPGNGLGNAIFVIGNYGYMTAGNKFYNFDVSSKSGSRPIVDGDGVTLSGTGVDIAVVGNYAYVVTTGSTELQIIDLSNPTNLSIVGQTNLNSAAAKSIFVDSSGNRAYVATANSSTQREMFIINISTKTGDQPVVGSYEGNGVDPKGITVVPGNRAILVGHDGEEYQVINIANEASPTHCGGSELDSGINDVTSVLESDGDAYSYIMTGEADAEFQVIIGGPGGTFSTNGEFESQTFSPGYATANNRLVATFNEPAGTDITFQVSLTGLVGGVCPTTGSYTFVGPDGTPGTVFNQASGEPITFPFTTVGTYTNPGQCFRYKVIFTTTNINSTPVLQEVVINYSP
jgi:type II secretory pathway pseudopilin PulG